MMDDFFGERASRVKVESSQSSRPSASVLVSVGGGGDDGGDVLISDEGKAADVAVLAALLVLRTDAPGPLYVDVVAFLQSAIRRDVAGLALLAAPNGDHLREVHRRVLRRDEEQPARRLLRGRQPLDVDQVVQRILLLQHIRVDARHARK
eukprot:CAMPEP_0118919168 /NCGR_PEP_ID=MMETSP1166-20130328/18402_1 /TAXON_ID=1104430 /ORGANISM="Chrysoreinhardia sp, Strain CCMP3193" /LENGTH=149 /DNA_ID=CAMNT_0006859669 /DNA_START=236 /DNA_END=686 /DNA_ORIENTATION=+